MKNKLEKLIISLQLKMIIIISAMLNVVSVSAYFFTFQPCLVLSCSFLKLKQTILDPNHLFDI